MMRFILLFLLFLDSAVCYESPSLMRRKKMLQNKDEEKQHRKLEELSFNSYEFSSRASDFAMIDLDVAEMKVQLGPLTSNSQNYSFATARKIYTQGANAMPYASIVLRSGIARDYPKGATVSGRDMGGRVITGILKTEVRRGDTNISISYSPSDNDGIFDCRVGANPSPVLDGCFEGAGQIQISGDSYGYIYTPRVENLNDETLQFFSTRAQDEMYECDHCPYEDYEKFYDYYGQHDYADEFIMAAFNRISTRLVRGNADFGELTRIAYKNVIETATLVLNVWMYVIKEMESAIDSCTNHKCSSITPSQCDTDYDAYNWDRAVALYSGILQMEGSVGFLLYNLANQRCVEFATCGRNGGRVQGDAQINYDAFSRFISGRRHLLSGDCTAARGDKENIVKMMTVPLVQGTLRHAYLDENHFDSDNRGQGAIYAASILPIIQSCNENDAIIIYDNLHTRAGTTDFLAVKRALERNYQCMNIGCGMVGGIMERNGNGFIQGAEPCGSHVVPEVHASYTNDFIPPPPMTPYPIPVAAPPRVTAPPRANGGGGSSGGGGGGGSSHHTRSHYNNARLNLGALIGAAVLVTLSGCVVLILCRTWKGAPIIKDGEKQNYGIEIRETLVANVTSYNNNDDDDDDDDDDDEPSFTIT